MELSAAVLRGAVGENWLSLNSSLQDFESRATYLSDRYIGTLATRARSLWTARRLGSLLLDHLSAPAPPPPLPRECSVDTSGSVYFGFTYPPPPMRANHKRRARLLSVLCERQRQTCRRTHCLTAYWHGFFHMRTPSRSARRCHHIISRLLQ